MLVDPRVSKDPNFSTQSCQVPNTIPIMAGDLMPCNWVPEASVAIVLGLHGVGA